MASVSVDASVTDHTLPTYFAGLGYARLNSGDFGSSSYRTVLQNLNPEVIRLNPFHGVGTVASPDSSFTNARDMCAFLGTSVGVWMGTTGAHPSGQPSSISEVGTTNYASDSHSPTEMANWLADFLSHGVNVLGMEFYNEPDFCATGSGGSGPGDGPWFGAGGGSPSQSDINKCETWAASIHRQYRAAVASKVATLGVAMPKIGGHVVSSAQDFAQTWAKKFANGKTEGTVSGATWPYADSNFDGYYDVHAFHPYQKGNTNQGLLNSIFVLPTGDHSTWSLATRSFLDTMRSYFDAHGKTSMKLAYNEFGNSPGNAYSGLVDVAQAILGFGWQKTYNIDYFTAWSGNRSSNTASDFPICVDTSYTLLTRSCAQRDLVFYFSRNYKKILSFGQAGSNTPSSGDAGGNNNAVPRLPWVAGLNAAGNKIAVLVCNLDLSNNEAFTFNWTNATSTGDVTGKNLQQSTTTTGSTSLPSILPITPSGASFTKTIEAGASYIFEIPVTVSGTGGGGGTSPPPFPAASSATIDDFNRSNGDPGTNWVTIQGDPARPSISSNALVGAGSFSRMVYVGNYYSSDQECYITIKSVDQYVDLFLRYIEDTDTGYLSEYESDTHNVNVYRVDGTGVFTILGAVNTGRALVDLDILGFRASSNTLTTWLNGTQLSAITDNTYLGGGRMGLGINSIIGNLDVFGGGGNSTPATVKRRRGKRTSGPRTGSGGSL